MIRMIRDLTWLTSKTLTKRRKRSMMMMVTSSCQSMTMVNCSSTLLSVSVPSHFAIATPVLTV